MKSKKIKINHNIIGIDNIPMFIISFIICIFSIFCIHSLIFFIDRLCLLALLYILKIDSIDHFYDAMWFNINPFSLFDSFMALFYLFFLLVFIDLFIWKFSLLILILG